MSHEGGGAGPRAGHSTPAGLPHIKALVQTILANAPLRTNLNIPAANLSAAGCASAPLTQRAHASAPPPQKKKVTDHSLLTQCAPASTPPPPPKRTRHLP
eukprot:365926-Chlamydomonas_euryale.AAC.6